MLKLCLVVALLSIFCKEASSSDYHLPLKCANDSCSECYSTLVRELLQDEKNYVALQKTFFPPSSTSPVFLEVFYQYGNDTGCKDDDAANNYPCTYFWSSAVYFFFHPVRVFQFTSLLFSDPSLRYGNVVLYLPEECRSANESLILLTQRVSQSRQCVWLRNYFKAMYMHQLDFYSLYAAKIVCNAPGNNPSN